MRRLIVAVLAGVLLSGAAGAQPLPQAGCWFTPWGKNECMADQDMQPLWRNVQEYCHYERRHDRYDSRYTYYKVCEGPQKRDDTRCRPVCTQWDENDNCTHYRNPCQQ